ncbi:hypothetical protein L345_17289, partial [Ophiophagus hannah]
MARMRWKQVKKSARIIFAGGNVWKQHRQIGATRLKFLSQGKSGLEHKIQEEALHLIEVFDSTEGSETASTTLHWALLYMVAYPDIQAKVQKELDDVLGSSSRLISCSDRRKLPYPNAVIHEIQRYANIILIGGPRQS